MSIDIHNCVNTYIYTYIIMYTKKYRIWLWPVQTWGMPASYSARP